LETEVLPARLDIYDPGDLDAVMAAGEVVWVGVEPLGERDGRVALYLADHLPRLLTPDVRLKSGNEVRLKSDTTSEGHGRLKADTLDDEAGERSDREEAILEFLRGHGASFFAPLHD